MVHVVIAERRGAHRCRDCAQPSTGKRGMLLEAVRKCELELCCMHCTLRHMRKAGSISARAVRNPNILHKAAQPLCGLAISSDAALCPERKLRVARESAAEVFNSAGK
jgi:hypothetical protein